MGDIVERGKQAYTYVQSLFQQFYSSPAPPQLLEYYVNILLSPQVTNNDTFKVVVDQVTEHVQSLGIDLVRQYQQTSHTENIIGSNSNNPSVSGNSSELISDWISNADNSNSSSNYTNYNNYNTHSTSAPTSPQLFNMPSDAQIYEQTGAQQSYNEIFATAQRNINPGGGAPDFQSGGGMGALDPKTAKEYVDLLFQKYTGKLGDPASAQFLLKSSLNKSYTLTQAEYYVKFCKEGKAYAQKVKKQQGEEARLKKLREYTVELFRVYAPFYKGESEIDNIVAKLGDGSMSLQDAEDDVKLFGLSSIKPPSGIPK